MNSPSSQNTKINSVTKFADVRRCTDTVSRYRLSQSLQHSLPGDFRSSFANARMPLEPSLTRQRQSGSSTRTTMSTVRRIASTLMSNDVCRISYISTTTEHDKTTAVALDDETTYSIRQVVEHLFNPNLNSPYYNFRPQFGLDLELPRHRRANNKTQSLPCLTFR